MTKKVEITNIGANRHVYEKVIGRKLEPGERVFLEVWPPGTDPDASNDEKLARLRKDVAEGLLSLEEDGPIPFDMEEMKREAGLD